jgi:hypothetical protein
MLIFSILLNYKLLKDICKVVMYSFASCQNIENSTTKYLNHIESIVYNINPLEKEGKNIK